MIILQIIYKFGSAGIFATLAIDEWLRWRVWVLPPISKDCLAYRNLKPLNAILGRFKWF